MFTPVPSNHCFIHLPAGASATEDRQCRAVTCKQSGGRGTGGGQHDGGFKNIKLNKTAEAEGFGIQVNKLIYRDNGKVIIKALRGDGVAGLDGRMAVGDQVGG